MSAREREGEKERKGAGGREREVDRQGGREGERERARVLGACARDTSTCADLGYLQLEFLKITLRGGADGCRSVHS